MLDSLDHGIIIVLLEQEGYDSHLASYVRMFKEDLLRPRLDRCAAYLSSDITPHSKPVLYFFALVARYWLIILLSPTISLKTTGVTAVGLDTPRLKTFAKIYPLRTAL